MDKYVNEKLGESGLLMVDFNPTSMGDFESNQLKNERGYTFTKDMNDSLVISIYNWKFTKGSTILDKKITIPKKNIFQYLPVTEKEKNTEVIRMRNGYLTDTLTSTDIQKIVEIGGKVTEIQK